MTSFLKLFVVAFFCAAALPAAETLYRVEPAFPQLAFNNPLFLAPAPDAVDAKGRLCVAEQHGFVRCFDNDPAAGESRLVLDISKKIRMSHNEEGLLGLAFHAGTGGRGAAYVFYSASAPLRSVIAEYACDFDPLAIDAASEKTSVGPDRRARGMGPPGRARSENGKHGGCRPIQGDHRLE